MAEFLTRSGVVDLRKEGEQVASQVYSSEALDNLDGTPLEAFIRVFVAEQANAEAMERAFHVLAVIGTKHRRFRYRCIGFIGSTMLLDIISQHKNVEAVQRKAMYFLNVLSVDESSRDVLIDAGVAKVLAEVMTANLHSEQVLERACTATSNFALEKGLRKVVMGQQGSIQILMRVATEMSSNPTIVLASLLSIHNLTQECQENTMICRIENVADLVFKTSIRFQKNVQIQGEVAVILTNIVRQDTELKQRICQSTTDLNAVLDMLKLSADSKSLTKHSLELLRRVIDRNGDAIKFVSDQAIMGLLRERIEAYLEEPEVVEHACAILRAMGFLPEPREHMREAGIFPCIVAGLRKHKANHTVVEECICAISNACVLNTANQDSLGMQGAVEATVQAMEQHREHVKTQDYGCRALRNLADNSEFNIRLEGDCGAIVAAALAMLGFPDNPILAEQACAALLNMARSEQNVIRMLEQDVQDIVNQALARIESDAFKKQGKRLISVLERPLNSEAGVARSESAFTRTITRGITQNDPGLKSSRSATVNQRSISRRMSRMRTKSMSRVNETRGTEKESENDLKARKHKSHTLIGQIFSRA